MFGLPHLRQSPSQQDKLRYINSLINNARIQMQARIFPQQIYDEINKIYNTETDPVVRRHISIALIGMLTTRIITINHKPINMSRL